MIFTARNSSGSSGRVRGGAEKHEIYAAAFGGHLFYDLFSQGWGGYGPLGPPLDPLLRKRSLGQGNIFSSMCQEFCSWGESASVHAEIPHPQEQIPPEADTVNKRAVCILLECNFVSFAFNIWRVEQISLLLFTFWSFKWIFMMDKDFKMTCTVTVVCALSPSSSRIGLQMSEI